MSVKIDENNAFYDKLANSTLSSNHHDFWSIVDIASGSNSSTECPTVRVPVSMDSVTGSREEVQQPRGSHQTVRKPITKVYHRRGQNHTGSLQQGPLPIAQQSATLLQEGQND